MPLHRQNGYLIPPPTKMTEARTLKPEEYTVEKEPYYEPTGSEIEVFEAAWNNQLPVLLKGPTGLRQDPLHGIHGMAAQAPFDHGLLPR